jgi:dsDNA-specific endonuclease/ATPase MutS2
VHLGNVLPADLSDLPEFGFQLIFFQQKESNWNEPIVKRFKINPLKFYKETSFQSNSYFGENAMVLQITVNIQAAEMDKITEADFQQMVHEKMDKPVDEKPVRARTPELVEIDLHINELIDNTSGLSNGEILEIQKEKVESEMKAAIQTGVKKIVFIHGVGQGVLKQEVINLLKTKYKKYYTQDASFREYGFGATMVILRR